MEQTTSLSQARRFLTQELAHVEIYGKSGQFLCKIGNLSATGAFLEILNPNFSVESGELIRVTVNLNKVNRVHVIDCVVVWTKTNGIGIHFLKRTELQEKLTQLMSKIR